MKRLSRGVLIFFLLAVFLFIGGGCANDDANSDSGKTEEKTAVVTGVTLNSTILNLVVGEVQTITATVNGTNLADKTVSWESSQPDVVKVENGKVTALSVGTARITAKAHADTSKSAYCDVTVEEATMKESTKTDKTVGTSAAAYNYSYTGSGATIYVYSQSGGLNFYGIKVGDKIWNPATFGVNTYSETTELASNDVTFTAVLIGEDTMSIDTSSKTISSTKFTHRFKTGGGGSQASRCLKIAVDSATDFVFYACSSSGSESRTMIIEVVENDAPTVTIVRPDSVSLDKTTASLARTDDDSAPTVTLKATLSPANVTEGYEKITWSTNNASVATVKDGVVTAVGPRSGTASATITATTVNGKTATCEVTVTASLTANYILASDTPTGWASYMGTKDLAGGTVTPPTNYGGNGASASKIYTVSTRADLLSALSGTEAKIIYIDGMIDMTEGMLPATASGSTTALDTWIKTKAAALTDTSKYGEAASKVTSFATWKTWYAAGNTNTADESGVYKAARSSLSNSYGSQIKISVPSNTTIIGLTKESGIKGGCIKISGVTNVVLRNLIIQDAFDPFPQIEKGDGFNANWDCIEISGSCKYIWIDHCTLQDTIATTDDDFDHVALGDGTNLKYQVFDGLCDIKQKNDFVTVSYCKLANHDKTSLIGHSASYTDDLKHQTITLHHNYYYNCGQRLPMVRMATIHIYNNYYVREGGRTNSYCIGLREQNSVYAENNYFGDGVNPTSNNQGNYYFKGNYGKDDAGTAAWNPADYYSYTADSAADARTDVIDNAGAGVWTVKK